MKRRALIHAMQWLGHIAPTVYHPHRSVLHSAPYWKCIIDHPAHLKANMHCKSTPNKMLRNQRRQYNDCVASHHVIDLEVH